MQLLLIHSDYIEFEARQPTRMAEEIEDSAKRCRLEEALCAFIAVEKFDEDDPDAVVAEGAQQISEVAESISASRIMLYPYAHLSPNLSTPA
ncbi:MAG: threonyl-tRNA synthetase editing domain-containing protein, partial [Methanothrix sp.]|nr:threonyl-tRNA synthetase editing domain-containing protein [Methanothrix sp.]